MWPRATNDLPFITVHFQLDKSLSDPSDFQPLEYRWPSLKDATFLPSRLVFITGVPGWREMTWPGNMLRSSWTVFWGGDGVLSLSLSLSRSGGKQFNQEGQKRDRDRDTER